MKVVLVSGKLQSGKNTFTDFFIEEVKHTKTIDFEYFAKPVKQECREVFKNLINYLNEISKKYNIEELKTEEESWYEKKNEITRILLQTYGTDIFRDKVDSNWWAKKLKYKLLKREEDVIVITDVRFKSEVEIISELEKNNIQVYKIRIERSNFVRDDNPIHKHQSEIDLDDYKGWDKIIYNDNGLEELKEQAINFSKYI
jgi:dephospho-CoA kinase